MKFRIKSLLIFSLIITILVSVSALLLDRALVENLGPQGYILGLSLIACVLLILSGYVWDRETRADIGKLKQHMPAAPVADPDEPLFVPGEASACEQSEIFGIARRIEQMAQSLQKVDARYRAIVEDQTDLVCRFLPDGKLTFVNTAYCQSTGQGRETVLGQPFFIFDPDHDQTIVKRITRLSPEDPITTFEYCLNQGEGKKRWHHWTNRAIFDSYGRLFEHQAVGRDITETKSLEAQVRQSQKLDSIGQLAAGIAHDYNNILTVIQGHASLLSTGDRSPETIRKSAEQISIATDHASNLSRQLLVFSNRQVMHMEPIDLNDTLNHLTRMLRRILGEPIAVELACSEQAALIEADRGMMEQIIFNLAVNARDAMPDGGRLIIGTSFEAIDSRKKKRHSEACSGRFVKLMVKDTGCGIAPEALPKIFEPFFTTKGVGKGSGLGLATVYGIVKQHKGWIEVGNDPEMGAQFEIFIPAAEIKAHQELTEPAPLQSLNGTETILLAEDETVLRELIKSILEDLGYRVLDNESGVAALRTWEEHKDKIDLLLTDLVMPDGVSGRELANNLHAEAPDLTVIYMSGYSADIVGKNIALEQGVNFLQKPFEPNALARLIRRRLDERTVTDRISDQFAETTIASL